MMGKKGTEGPMFFYVTLEELVPQDHFLRSVLEVVDFSFIHSKVKHLYSHTGKPSVDPVVLLKIMLIGYLYGIVSERRLMQEIQVNLAYRYFIGYSLEEDIPDHSTLSRNRNERFKDSTFQEIFDEIVFQCKAYGLIQADDITFDSTTVEANASLDSLEPRKVDLRPDEYIKKVTEENPVENNDLEKEIPNKKDNKKKTKLSNKDHVSKTDPDAAIIKKPGKKSMLAYSNHLSVDTKERIITGVMATPADVSDDKPLIPMLKRQSEKFGLKPQKIIADKKYGTGKNFKKLADMGHEAFIPVQKHSNKKGLFDQDKFSFDPKEDIFICPEGKSLKFFRYGKTKETKRYKAESSDCLSCPKRSKCTTSKNGRMVDRSIHQDLINEAKDRMKTPRGRLAAKKRMTTSETINAEAKTCHGLLRCRYRGQDKAQIQFLMTAAAQNIKRMVQAVMRRKAKAEAMAMEGHEKTIAFFVKIRKAFCPTIFDYQGAIERG